MSVAKGDLDLGKLEDEAEKKQHEEAEAQYKDLVEKIKTALGEQVKEVRVTLRLTDSPACLVADEHDMTGNLARMLKAAGQKVPESKPILEINPEHPLVQRLKYEDGKFDDWATAVRPGRAGRRRHAGGPGRVREAPERADAGDGVALVACAMEACKGFQASPAQPSLPARCRATPGRRLFQRPSALPACHRAVALVLQAALRSRA